MEAIKQLHPGKSPGSDGLTSSFYKHFAASVAPIFSTVFNKAFKIGSLSANQYLAIIILLYKCGLQNVLMNYQPISLTNTDYKILAYVLTNRLEPHLSFLISLQQAAYMKGHFIGMNIRSVQDFIDHTIETDSSHLVLFLDFWKAFESISHRFLLLLLEHIGLPEWYVKWVNIIYTRAISVVRHKNWLTDKISLGCGVHQGCPLSCHLFNLVGQVLIYSLRDHGLFSWWMKLGHPSSQYADDIVLLIMDVHSLPKIIKHISYVGSFTGLSLNLEKTIVFNHKINGKHIIHGITMSNTPVKYLGAFLGQGDLSKLNFEKPLQNAHRKYMLGQTEH